MWTLHVILIALTNSGITAIETRFTTPDFGHIRFSYNLSFSTGTVFFSPNKSTGTVFQLVFSAKRTAPALVQFRLYHNKYHCLGLILFPVQSMLYKPCILQSQHDAINSWHYPLVSITLLQYEHVMLLFFGITLWPQ